MLSACVCCLAAVVWPAHARLRPPDKPPNSTSAAATDPAIEESPAPIGPESPSRTRRIKPQADAQATTVKADTRAGHPEPLPRPTDPNSSPQLRSPLGGWGPHRGAAPPPTKFRRANTRRVFSLSVIPQYAAIKAPLVGREDRVRRGGGASIEAELRALRWLFIRLLASYSAHPVDEETSSQSDPARTPIASAGRYHATLFGASLVYPLDLGRVVSTVDVGGGGMIMSSPEGRVDGQRGRPCLSGGVCDFGLACGAQGTCEATVVPQFNLSLSVDVLLGVRWSLGAQIRYFGLLSSISDGANGLPQLLTVGLRLGVRW